MEPQIQYAKTTDGVNIAYAVFGEGPLLITTPSTWESLSFALDDSIGGSFYDRLAKTYRVVRYDRRATGLSDPNSGPATLETDVEDIAAVASALAVDAFSLMGSFQLGPGAMAYTSRHTDRVARLILYSTYAYGRDLTNENVKASIISMVRSHWGIARRTLADLTSPGVSGEILERIASDEGHSASGETVAQLLELAYAVDVRELLSQITIPTLVLHRRGDRAVPFSMGRALASCLQNVRFVPLEGVIHWPWFGDSDSVIGAIHQFLREGEQQPESSRELPSGMTAILFADIADSTALTERLGDSAFRAKARDLDGALRAAIRERGGTPVEGKLLGDGVLAVFMSAREAIEAAVRCRDEGNREGLPLHLGIHAGDVIREDNNVYGGAVNIASRIAGLSAPGEVLVSETVRSLARTSAGVRFEDRGEQALKGVGEAVRVWAVVEQEK